MLQAFASLLLTVGLLVLALRLLRRMPGGGGTRGREMPFEVLQRVSLGPRQGAVLLRIGGRVLVVSVADSHSQLLTELGGEELTTALHPAPARGAESGWNRWPSWRRLVLVAALALLPVGLSAQGMTVPPPAGPRATQSPRTSAPTVGPQVQGPTPPKVELRIGEGANELKLSGAVGIVVFMGALTLLPAIFMLMTSFTRILIVLHFLRSALGTQTTPPTQLLVAIAVLLSGVVMNPVLQEANEQALQPYFNGQISQVEAYHQAVQPLRKFMLANTREQDLATFAELSRVDSVATVEDLPTVTVMSAFVTSELRTAFQMGFVIFLPFIVVDLIVASVLMSMGMFMLPPVMVSLPFKLLLFVLADGWTLVVQNLVTSFRI